MLFVGFDPVPVSAASIAQVHKATVMPEPEPGREEAPREPRSVAVKILRPGIERAFERDLEFFYWLAEWVERTQPKLRRFRPIRSEERSVGKACVSTCSSRWSPDH